MQYADDSPDQLADPVARAFTCIECGYAVEREVPLLCAEISSVCVNCGDFAVHLASEDDLETADQDTAAVLADVGPLTKRQAQAYVYRELMGVSRERTARAMETSKSNVDNLHRRARGKTEEAERFVAAIRDLRGDDGTDIASDGDDRQSIPATRP